MLEKTPKRINTHFIAKQLDNKCWIVGSDSSARSHVILTDRWHKRLFIYS